MATNRQLLNRLARTYASAQVQLLERIATRESKGSVAGYERALLADVQAIASELDSEAGAWLKEAVPQFYLTGMQESVDLLAKAGELVKQQAALTKVHQSAVRVLVENAHDDLKDAHRMVGRRVKDNLRRIGLDAVTTKTTTGATVRDTSAALRERLAAEGIQTVQGMRLESYADLVARTTTAEATNRGTINQLTALDYDLVQITEHDSPCPICSMYEGRIYSVSGDSKDYPALYETAFGDGFANLHPNCRHRAVPYIPALADDAAADKERSNAPFTDNRSTRQRDAYREAQNKKRQTRERRREREARQLSG